MQKLLLLSGIALLSLTSISLSPKPAMAGCGWGDITCNPTKWTCPPGGCRVEEEGATLGVQPYGGGMSGGSEVRNNRSGNCLQTMGEEKANGSTVNIWDCTNSSNQFWTLTSKGELRNNRSGKCLQTMGEEKANGSTVNIWDCTNSSNQSWERTSNGEFRNNRSGKCLQTMGEEKANGSTVNIWDCTNSSNQSWR
jgi:hypothetical protein